MRNEAALHPVSRDHFIGIVIIKKVPREKNHTFPPQFGKSALKLDARMGDTLVDLLPDQAVMCCPTTRRGILSI